MKATKDPWADALSRWVASDAPTAQGAAVTGGRSGRRRLVVIFGGIALAVAAVLGIIGAVVNHGRAEEWRERADTIQSELDRRTKELNRQTLRLNAAARTVRAAQRALERSEEDVEALETRQTELADEKAALEDQRAALVKVAQLLVTCNQGLSDAIGIIVAGGDPSFEMDVAAVNQACGAADTLLGGG